MPYKAPEYKIVDNHVELSTIPKRKKITMTRLPVVLGLNHWKSPFEAWCEINRVYEKPFEDNKYTIAGKTIEPIVRDFLKNRLEIEQKNKTNNLTYIKSPQEYFGNNYNEREWDYFKNDKLFGGKWDTVITDKDNKILSVVEQKTSSRPQDWVDGVPQDYAIQVLGYAYLMGLKLCVIAVTFLTDDDYGHPELFKPTLKNTTTFKLEVDKYKIMCLDGIERTISQIFDIAKVWSESYQTISPDFDKEKDIEILNNIVKFETQADINIIELDLLQKSKELSDLEQSPQVQLYLETIKQQKAIKDKLVNELKTRIGVNDKTSTEFYTLTRTFRQSVDTSKLKTDGIYDKYVKSSEVYSLSDKEEIE